MRNALLLLIAGSALASAQRYGGWADVANCSSISGRAWDADHPDTRIYVDIYDGGLPVGSAKADILREDLKQAGIGDGSHAYSYPVPSSMKDNRTHRIGVYFGGTSIPLNYGYYQFNITCSPLGEGQMCWPSYSLHSKCHNRNPLLNAACVMPHCRW
jgi:hypothetical protein